VRGVAGALVMVFSLLGLFVATPFTFGALAVGGGLLFSAVTNTCGMAKMLGMLPYNKNVTCNVRQVISDIAATQEVKTQGAD
jgi:hypothetical protein